MKRIFLSLYLLCGLVQAAPEMKVDQLGNPLLTQYSEGDFVDCVFRIVNLVETDTRYEFQLAGSYRGELVGMAVTMVKGIESGLDSKGELIKNHVYRRELVFSRTGPESDRLIRALSASYGIVAPKIAMTETESYTLIALHQGPIDMRTEPVILKLFGRDGPSSLESELRALSK